MMKFVRLGALLSVLLAAILMSGCMEMKEHLTLNDDLSGNVVVKIKLLGMMAGAIQQAPPPSEAEVEEAKKNCPEGVRLTKFGFEDADGTKLIVFAFDFDHVEKLRKLDMTALKPADKREPGEEPRFMFENLKVTKNEDGSYTYERAGTADEFKPETPGGEGGDGMDEGGEEDPMAAQMKAMLEGMMKDLKVEFRVTFPSVPTDSNADATEGNDARWTLDWPKIQEIEKSGKTPDPQKAKFTVAG